MPDPRRHSFPREPDSVPAARAALAELARSLDEPLLYDASLCLSELVTNAVQHPPPSHPDAAIEVEIDLDGDCLRVRVVDPGAGFAPPKPTEGDERGWGLFIVDQLATRWGTEPGERTVLWFEMAVGEELAA